MEETRFYADFGSFQRLRVLGPESAESVGTVLALMEELTTDIGWNCLVSVDPETPNADVQWAEVDEAYLDQACVEVDEDTARRIHPKLFEILDNPIEDEDED